MSVFKTRGGKLVVAGAGGVVVIGVVVALVVALVVVPDQRAAAEGEYNTASRACAAANSGLDTAMKGAQEALLGTDPTTLAPELPRDLNSAISTAKAVSSCRAPLMAEGGAAIRKQVEAINTDAARVDAAAADLAKATKLFTDSVAAKQKAEADAKAKAEAEKKARVRKGSVAFTKINGHAFNFAWDDLVVVAEVDATAGKPGNAVVSFHIEIGATLTHATPDKQEPVGSFGISVRPVWADDNSQFCSLFPETDGELKCGSKSFQDNLSSFRVNGKRYLSPGRLNVNFSKSWEKISETNTWDLHVGPTRSVEVAADKAQAVASALESPTALMVYDSRAGSMASGPWQVYTCVGKAENVQNSEKTAMCLIGLPNW